MSTMLFAVLLTIMQAAPPIPGQAANHGTQNPENVKKDTAQNKQPVAPKASLVPEKPKRNQVGTAENSTPNAEQTVRVRELPSVSVSRDWMDKVAWGASIALSLVGILGIGFAYWTLKALRKQTDTLVSVERAWIFAEIGALPPDFAPEPNQLQIMNLPITLRNRGNTPGRIVRLSARAHQLEPSEPLPSEPNYLQIDETDVVLPPNSSEGQGLAIQPIRIQLPGQDFIAIFNGQRALYVYGFVDYLALGENRKQTCFCWRYHVQSGGNPLPSGFHIMANTPPAYLRCS